MSWNLNPLYDETLKIKVMSYMVVYASLQWSGLTILLGARSKISGINTI